MKNKMTLVLIMIASSFIIRGITRPSFAQDNPNPASPLPSLSIPAGPRPTATVTPLQSSPQPTATVTPLPSAAPSGTQPQTTNTVSPAPRR